jgi:hypothetical protein
MVRAHLENCTYFPPQWVHNTFEEEELANLVKVNDLKIIGKTIIISEKKGYNMLRD